MNHEKNLVNYYIIRRQGKVSSILPFQENLHLGNKQFFLTKFRAIRNKVLVLLSSNGIDLQETM